LIQQAPNTVYELLSIQEDDEDPSFCAMSECVDTEALARFVLDAAGDLEPSMTQVERAIAALERYKITLNAG